MMMGIVAGQARRPAVPAGTPYWPQVALLMPLDGNANDVKGNVFTAAGTPAFASGKYGQGLQSPSGDSGYYTEPGIAALALSGDFTIRFYIRVAPGTPQGAVIACFTTAEVNQGWEIFYHAGGYLQWYQYWSSGSYPISTSSRIDDGELHLIEFERVGATLNYYIDRTLDRVASGSYAYSTEGTRLSVGYQYHGQRRYPFQGLIDDLLIVNGLALINAGYPPPDGPHPHS